MDRVARAPPCLLSWHHCSAPGRLGPGAADAEKFDGEMFARFTVCVGFCCRGVVGVNAVVFVIEVTHMQLARICCIVLPTVM